jgi:hypothetical protein
MQLTIGIIIDLFFWLTGIYVYIMLILSVIMVLFFNYMLPFINNLKSKFIRKKSKAAGI